MDFHRPVESPPRTLNIEQQAEFLTSVLQKFVMTCGEHGLPKFPPSTRHDLRNKNKIKATIISILDRCYKAKEELNKLLHFKDKDFVILNSYTRLIHRPELVKDILKFYTDNNLEDIKDYDIQQNIYKTSKGKVKKITKLNWAIPGKGNWEKEKAKYGESITPTTIYVTSNPLEILLQGVNSSWSSCNDLFHSHWGECISHALSQTAFIAFITSDKFAGEIFIPKKTARTWMYLEELEKTKRLILAGGGTYQCGDPTDSYSTAGLRQNIVLEILKYINPPKEMFPSLLEVRANASPGFWDVTHSSGGRRLILASMNHKQTVKHWLSVSKGVGTTIPCIFCGAEHKFTQGICEMHQRGNGKFYCDVCDKEIARSEVKEANSNYYCKTCFEQEFFHCGICSSTHTKDKKINLHVYKDGSFLTMNICHSCKTSMTVKQCATCGKYMHILYPFIEDEEGNILCPECHDTTKTSN